jgi:CHAT domain-containing protein
MSRIPWETLHLGNGAAPALGGGLSHRYDGGVLSVAKWAEERAQDPDLNVLLVVDPTENLEGAREEGDRIEKLLRERLPSARLRELRGPQARRKELLDCFASGRFDVVHYAGHAFFDPSNRGRSGILCYGGEVLSGNDLASLSRLPALVIFNACESARVRRMLGAEDNQVVEKKVDDPVRGTVSFAESFLAGGVANYIGTYWPVGDAAAKTFAETFYGALLTGAPISGALLEARRAVSRLNSGAADWSDYVFYGDPAFRLKAGPIRQSTFAGSAGSPFVESMVPSNGKPGTSA